MRGDEHVGEREQPRQFVVVQHLAGKVLVEDAFLLLVNVQRHTAKAAGLQRLDQGRGVNQRAPADVDEDGAGLHQAEGFAPDDVLCLRGQRNVQRNNIAAPASADASTYSTPCWAAQSRFGNGS